MDGVEIVEGPPATFLGREGTQIFVPKTERFEDFTLHANSLEDPVVVKFVNARHEGTFPAFLARYGPPRFELAPPHHPGSIYVVDAEVFADDLGHRLLYSTNHPSPKQNIRWMNETLK